jgi:hypothetical protein
MRIPFISLFIRSPFEGLQAHAEKVKECAWAFQQAIECHISDQCKTFEEFRAQVDMLETEADAIKIGLRSRLPKRALMPVDKFQLLRYLREQDKVLDAIEEALDWISFRSEPGIPPELQRDFFSLVDTILDPVEEMCGMIAAAGKYFKNFSAKQGKLVHDIIHTIREQEQEADKVEDAIKHKVLNMHIDPVTIFHLIKLAETIGSIADHAESAGDMMGALLAK